MLQEEETGDRGGADFLGAKLAEDGVLGEGLESGFGEGVCDDEDEGLRLPHSASAQDESSSSPSDDINPSESNQDQIGRAHV